MKIVTLLLLGLASLAVSVPQSRFGHSRFQPARADDTGDTTEASDVADHPAGRGKTTKADLDAAGPDAGADEVDPKEDTSAKPFVVDGEKKPAYGLDVAKERRRLANLRRHFVKPNNEEGEESAVTTSPDDMHAAAPASGHRRAAAGQHNSNDEQAAAPASGHRMAGSDKQDSNDEESNSAKVEGSRNPPASNPRRRFHSTSSSSSSVSDASQGNKEETSAGSEDDSSDQPQKETTIERRKPPLRRRQQSTPAPSDAQSHDESIDAGSNTHSGDTDSTSPAEKHEPAAGTQPAGSLKERLERYRQRQSGRLGAASQTGAGDGSTDAQTSDALSNVTAESDAKPKFNAKAESDAMAVSSATADAPATGSNSQNSGDDRSTR